MTAADHDMMGEDDAACRHAAIPRVIGHRTADTAHQTTCVQTIISDSFMGRGELQHLSLCRLTTSKSAEKPLPLLALCKSLSKQQVEQMCWGQQNAPPGLLVVPRSFRTQSSW